MRPSNIDVVMLVNLRIKQVHALREGLYSRHHKVGEHGTTNDHGGRHVGIALLSNGVCYSSWTQNVLFNSCHLD
jgi:hypothetical protein